ncbi:hypothetical protein RRG08_018587 [Elysia crispata]|uniref:Uncharacterized protein n=1 Tax=Elysia crispata TaxID=231223 RepID=A0AAE1DT92_9GAST|nr:hypothetical protein RRG08_018587 [Elysia crispata]
MASTATESWQNLLNSSSRIKSIELWRKHISESGVKLVKFTDILMSGQTGSINSTDILMSGQTGSINSTDILMSGQTGSINSTDILMSGQTGEVNSTDILMSGQTGSINSTDILMSGQTGSINSTNILMSGQTGEVNSTDILMSGQTGEINSVDILLSAWSCGSNLLRMSNGSDLFVQVEQNATIRKRLRRTDCYFMEMERSAPEPEVSLPETLGACPVRARGDDRRGNGCFLEVSTARHGERMEQETKGQTAQFSLAMEPPLEKVSHIRKTVKND